MVKLPFLNKDSAEEAENDYIPVMDFSVTISNSLALKKRESIEKDCEKYKIHSMDDSKLFIL